jgi:type II secretory pathway pseudopilin PulG
MVKRRHKFFTLIEVVVALAILTGGIMSAMAIVSMSKNRMDKAYNSFNYQHMLAQAAEYYLLCGDKPINQDFFPYRGYTASCAINDCKNIQGVSPNTGGNWKLATYDISVRGPNGQIISEVKVDKLYKNDIFQQR